MKPSFLTRLFTPKNTLIAGAIGAVLIAFKGSIGVFVGLAVWVGLAAISKQTTAASGTRSGTRREPVDPYAIGDPWRGLLLQTNAALERFRNASTSRPGFQSLRDKFDDAADECAEIAKTGDTVDDAIRACNGERLKADLAMAEAELRRNTDTQRTAALTGRRDALQQQITTVHELEGESRHVLDQLREVVARLEEAVVQAMAASASPATNDVLTTRADRVLDEARALRAAAAEVDRISKQAGL